MPRRSGMVALALCASVAACGPAPAVARPTPTASSTSPAATSPAVAQQPVRVAIIVMENHSIASVIGLPYIRSLATSATVLTDYRASSHPSLPNYLALTSGLTWGITDDGYHVLPELDIGDQLTGAGVAWRAYMEGMTADCLHGTSLYAVKHDPFAYYGGRCQSSVVPFSHIAGDLVGTSPPRLLWITPDLCHDMHDCPSAVGDSWLQQTVPALLEAPAMSNGVVVITWDENDGGGSNQVLSLVLGSKHAANPGQPSSHPALLATVEDLLGVPRLAAVRGVTAIALR